jgi:ABC-type transport system substrate-binding protein
VKVKPGIYFASDPAFKGQRRELVAEDYVYSFKRFADPAVKSSTWTWMDTTFKFVGLAELRQQAIEGKKPFDYAKPIEGIRALDRYTVQFMTSEPSPRFITGALAASDLTGAVAREVVSTMATPSWAIRWARARSS